MNRILALAGGVGLFFVLSSPAWCQARLPFAPTDQELLMLPQECKIRLRGTPEEINTLNKRLAGLEGVHHYCFGLNFMNRARFASLDKTEKRFNLQNAIGEFGYVLKHSTPDAKGLQEVKAQKGQAEMMLKMLH